MKAGEDGHEGMEEDNVMKMKTGGRIIMNNGVMWIWA